MKKPFQLSIGDIPEIVEALEHYAPKCSACGELATRTFHHVSGNRMDACDNDHCLTEEFCINCKQVRYDDDPSSPCSFCGTEVGRTRQSIAYEIKPVQHANILRELNKRNANRSHI